MVYIAPAWGWNLIAADLLPMHQKPGDTSPDAWYIPTLVVLTPLTSPPVIQLCRIVGL